MNNNTYGRGSKEGNDNNAEELIQQIVDCHIEAMRRGGLIMNAQMEAVARSKIVKIAAIAITFLW